MLEGRWCFGFTRALVTAMRPAPLRGSMANAKIVVPVRYSAWLSGDLGRQIEEMLQNALGGLEGTRITRLPRALLVEAEEDPGPLLEATHRAAHDIETAVARTYPVFHHEMGPVWTGTLQAVFAQPLAVPERPLEAPVPA